ncbi:hypothetical protein ACHAWF_005984, partial [Thalassiosira exigua]
DHGAVDQRLVTGGLLRLRLGQLHDRLAGPDRALVRRILEAVPPRLLRFLHHARREAVEYAVRPADVRRVVDELARHPLPNLHHAREHVRLVVALVQRRDRHDLGDGAEPEHFRAPELGEVGEAVGRELQRVGHQLVQAAQSGRSGLLRRGVGEVPQVAVGAVLLPHAPGPERAAVDVILQVVPDDVRLLKEQPHLVAQVQLPGQGGPLQPRRREEAAQALADEPGDEVAVSIVLAHVRGALPEVLVHELRHPRRHPQRDVGDDPTARLRQRGVHRAALGELLQQAPLVPLPAPRHVPRGIDQRRLVEGQEDPDLLLVRGEVRHVVLDCVERAQDEVEDEHVHEHVGGQLTDHGRERAGDFAQDLVAERQVGRVERVLDGVAVQVGFEGTDVEQSHGRPDLVEVHQLLRFGFLVRFDLAVGPLLFAA